MKKQFLAYWDAPHQQENEPKKRNKQKFYNQRSFSKQRSDKYKKHIIKSQSPKDKDFLEKRLTILQGKITVNVGHAKK